MRIQPRNQGSSASLALGVILATLAACTEDALAPPTFEPENGEWAYDELSVTQNTCPNDFYTPVDSTISILYDGGNSFIVNAGADNPFDCSLSGEEFECPNWSNGTVPVPGLTATVEYRVSALGNFSSETSGSGENTYRYTCTGADCATIEQGLDFTFPCSARIQFDIDRL
jgi:hypothetical protein